MPNNRQNQHKTGEKSVLMKREYLSKAKGGFHLKTGGGKMPIMKILTAAIFISVTLCFLKGTEYLFLILLCASIHEGGHIIIAKLLGVPLVRVKGGPFGIWLKYDFSGKSYLVQIAVSTAGAAFNVACAAMTAFFCRPLGLLSLFFIFSNLALAVFNLMPVSGFDGIGVIRCLLLLLVKEPMVADNICNGISAFFSGAFFLLTVYIQMRVGVSLTMLCVSVFLLFNCMKERLNR